MYPHAFTSAKNFVLLYPDLLFHSSVQTLLCLYLSGDASVTIILKDLCVGSSIKWLQYQNSTVNYSVCYLSIIMAKSIDIKIIAMAT